MKFASSERRRIAAIVAGALALVVSGAGCGKTHRKPTFEYVPHMAESFAVKAQHLGPFGEGMRVPPVGTLAVNAQAPYRYATDPEAAGRELKNPLPRSMKVLERGQKMYDTYCIVCHGRRAEGDGTIVPKFPRPPSLHSDKVRDWSDGRIFHVLTAGQNLMPSYASQISTEDRWAVIHYVRVLQRAVNPTPEDVREIEKAKGSQND